MLGILKFKLPEEKEEFDIAVKAPELKIAIEEFDEWLRGKIKHGDNPEAVKSELDSCRQKLYECLSNHNIPQE